MKSLLMGLQDSICAGLEQLDGDGRFQEESWVRPEGGGGRSRVLREGALLEQGGVNFSEVQGENLPPISPRFPSITAISKRVRFGGLAAVLISPPTTPSLRTPSISTRPSKGLATA